jgi:hypothetical protein
VPRDLLGPGLVVLDIEWFPAGQLSGAFCGFHAGRASMSSVAGVWGSRCVKGYSKVSWMFRGTVGLKIPR